ncbi:hypothetical protein LZ198_38960 [Myxococcus sp. K15C18031901]|nr:hypothetical protein [Myxococcus dinghuensis]
MKRKMYGAMKGRVVRPRVAAGLSVSKAPMSGKITPGSAAGHVRARPR